jgi:hypothetical protein
MDSPLGLMDRAAHAARHEIDEGLPSASVGVVVIVATASDDGFDYVISHGLTDDALARVDPAERARVAARLTELAEAWRP